MQMKTKNMQVNNILSTMQNFLIRFYYSKLKQNKYKRPNPIGAIKQTQLLIYGARHMQLNKFHFRLCNTNIQYTYTK